jgi:hypothetical protein
LERNVSGFSGHRMEIYVPEAVANDIIAISKSFNVDSNRGRSSRWQEN